MNPVGITLDKVQQKLYWADWGTDKIQRSNLDGTDVEDIIASGLNSPYDIALLPSESKLYWTERGDGTIKRSDMNGQNVETIVSTGATSRKPNGLFIDLDNHKLYFTIDFSGEKIQRSNFDGTQLEDVITENIASPHDVAVINNPITSSVADQSRPTYCQVFPNPFRDEFVLESKMPVKFLQMYTFLASSFILRNLSQKKLIILL